MFHHQSIAESLGDLVGSRLEETLAGYLITHWCSFRSSLSASSTKRSAKAGWRGYSLSTEASWRETLELHKAVKQGRVSGRCCENAIIHIGGQRMLRFIVALFLVLAAQQANAVECGSTANRAGCVSPNSATSYNKSTGQVHSAQPYHSNEVAPGTNVQGRRGNSATKAVQPGCAFVNGKRVCN